MGRVATPILVLDDAGLRLFAVTGAIKALDFGLGTAQAIILGAVTAVGGGTLRDVLIGKIPSVLSSGLYAVPALVGATIVVLWSANRVEQSGRCAAAAAGCFVIRMVGVRLDLDAPAPREGSHQRSDENAEDVD